MKKMMIALTVSCAMLFASHAFAAGSVADTPLSAYSNAQLAGNFGTPDLVAPMKDGSHMLCYNQNNPRRETYRCFILNQGKVQDIGFETIDDIIAQQR